MLKVVMQPTMRIIQILKYCLILFINVYNDIDPFGLKAPPKEPTRYGTSLAGVLFSKEELLDGMLPPVNSKLG